MIRFDAMGLALVFTCFALPALAAPPATHPAVARDGWPDTPAGDRARGWVEAFSTGEKAMKEYLSRAMSRERLDQRGLGARVERYRDMRERYGRLTLGAVLRSTETRLTVRLLDSSARSHEFVFAVEPEPPHRLESVGLKPSGHLQGLMKHLHR